MMPFFKTDSSFLLFWVLVWGPLFSVTWFFVVMRFAPLDGLFETLAAYGALIYGMFGPALWRLFVTGMRP